MKKFCLIWVSVASIKILGIVQYRRLKRVFHGLFAIFLSHKMFYDKLKMWHPEAKLIFPKLLDENLAVVKVVAWWVYFLSFDTASLEESATLSLIGEIIMLLLSAAICKKFAWILMQILGW